MFSPLFAVHGPAKMGLTQRSRGGGRFPVGALRRWPGNGMAGPVLVSLACANAAVGWKVVGSVAFLTLSMRRL
jgi:hypothetical protein